MCVLTTTYLVEAQSPPLSISFASPDVLQLSWPGNFTNWRLVSTTNLNSSAWLPLPVAPFPSNNALIAFLPITSSRNYYQLQQTGAGSCTFRATPSTIDPGASSTLTWCPTAGYTYRISPAPGGGSQVVTGNSLDVSPTSTTVYTLTASNALGVARQDITTIFCNPCGWLQVSNVDVVLSVLYFFSLSTPSYNFDIGHSTWTTFHLHRQAGTDTDAYFFGTATGDELPGFGMAMDSGKIKDREDDKTGPQVFTTTEVGGNGPVRHDVSTFTLHVTCSTYDFSYNLLINTTETSQFGTFNSIDGIGTGAITARPFGFETTDNTFVAGGNITAAYPPPGSGDYFVPSSDIGKQMFTSGAVTAPNASQAIVVWTLVPVP